MNPDGLGQAFAEIQGVADGMLVRVIVGKGNRRFAVCQNDAPGGADAIQDRMRTQIGFGCCTSGVDRRDNRARGHRALSQRALRQCQQDASSPRES